MAKLAVTERDNNKRNFMAVDLIHNAPRKPLLLRDRLR